MKLNELLEANYNAKSFFGSENAAREVVLKKGKKLTAFLKKNCQPWLKWTTNGRVYVYRGFASDPNETAFLKKVRKDRVPKDSHEWEHAGFNQLIRIGGGKANRSNSVFVNGDKYVADNYGQVYIVMPIGKFNFTWHTDEDDWTGHVNWADLLRIKQTTKQVDAAKVLKKDEMEQAQKDWEYQLDKNTKIVAAAKPKINAFFSQYGTSNLAPSQWRTYMYGISEILTANGGSFAADAKTKFKNVKAGVSPHTTYWYGGNKTLIKLKGLVNLYNELATKEQPEREQIRKDLMKVNNVIKKASFAVKWLGQWAKRPEVYIEKMSTSDDVAYGDVADTTWTPGKHKPSQIDVDRVELKRWLSKLHVDKDMIAGIRSENEIMISSNQIIAIEEEFYTNVVMPMLQGKVPKFKDKIAKDLLDPWDMDDY